MKRLKEIDILRGIAIILIMVGHFYQGYKFVDYIYTFHVPLFFFISGMCLNINLSWRDFIKKKIKAIFVPYLIFGIIIIPAKFIYEVDHSLLNFIKIMIKYLLQQRYTTLWFLSALLISQVLFYFIMDMCRKVNKTDYYAITFIIVLTIIACIYETYINISIPWNFDVGVLCIVFLASGYYFNKYLLNSVYTIRQIKKIYLCGELLLIGGALGIASIILSGERLDVCYGITGISLFSIPGSIMISMGLFMICQIIPYIKALELIGQHTMTIFALHQMLFKQYFLKTLKFDTGFLIFLSICITLFICLIIDIIISKSKVKWIIGKS